MNNALIIFTRVPLPGQTKTRLMPFLSGEECAHLHTCFIRDAYEKAKQVNADIFVFYTPEEEKERLLCVLREEAVCIPQQGEDLGMRMKTAIDHVLKMGYQKAILIGTDIPQIRVETFQEAFSALDEHDIVIHPTYDGGYYLIGMTREQDSIWKVRRYGSNTVIQDTLQHMQEANLTVALGEKYYDIDDKYDLKQLFCDIKTGVVSNCPNTEAYLESVLKEKMESLYEESSR